MVNLHFHLRAGILHSAAGDVAVTYGVFDLLVVDGASIMGERLVERMARPAQLLSAEVPYILFARHVDSSMVERPFS